MTRKELWLKGGNDRRFPSGQTVVSEKIYRVFAEALGGLGVLLEECYETHVHACGSELNLSLLRAV